MALARKTKALINPTMSKAITGKMMMFVIVVASRFVQVVNWPSKKVITGTTRNAGIPRITASLRLNRNHSLKKPWGLIQNSVFWAVYRSTSADLSMPVR